MGNDRCAKLWTYLVFALGLLVLLAAIVEATRSYPCFNCRGKYLGTRIVCIGTGKDALGGDCYVCDGTGRVICPVCHGSGREYVSLDPFNVMEAVFGVILMSLALWQIIGQKTIL